MVRKRKREKLQQQTDMPFVIESLSHEGRGVSHYGSHPEHPVALHGKKVFIAFALPGEQVLAKVTHSYRRYDEADCISVQTPAVTRTTPICDYFGLCGGCSLQHMHGDEQIRFKQVMLSELFWHGGELKPEIWLPAIRSNSQDYRRKARLGVRFVIKKNELLVGFRERKSSFLAQIDSCAVLDSRIGQSIKALKTLISGMDARDHIAQLEMAAGDDAVAMIVRHLVPLSVGDQTQLRDFCLARQWQLYLQPEGYDTVHRVDHPDKPMRLHYSLPEFNLRFAFSPLDFTQVNASVNEQIVSSACQLLALQSGERVLDLFCGLGNFTLALARQVGPTGFVVGVEGSADMAARGFENARLNQIDHVAFYAHDLTQDLSAQPWANDQFDAIVIDPPRSGAAEVIAYIAKFKAKRIVYVSCNPATLARDAALLAKAGYTLKTAGVMDMFTHTTHVESIALFSRER